jgi:outer membrane protein OmpA-like peptidoglycan-associated protein
MNRKPNIPQRTLSLITIAVMALALGACGSVPAENPALQDAHAAYNAADSNPRVRDLAAGEMMQAKTALDRADHARQDGASLAEVEHLAYVAKQRVGIANEVADRKLADERAAQANADRDRIRLEARTREADQAKADANAAQAQAVVAQSQAEAAQRQAQDAQAAAADVQARNTQLTILLQELHAKQTERGMVVTINDVLFDTNRAELKPGGMRSVEKLGALLKDDPSRRVQVEGFTDSTGSQATNDALSARRAESVRSALIGQGVPADRVSAKGMGESYPVASNDTAAGRQMNRRVEIVLQDANGPVAQR